MNNRNIAENIFLAGVKGVLPEKLITNTMKLEGSLLTIGEYQLSLENINNIYVIGAGKASAAMGHYVESILGDRISGGHIVVKYGYSCKLKRIDVTEAGHPVPDSNGFRASDQIVKISSKASDKDLVICLISGGGSALLADLPQGLLPEDLFIMNNVLIRCGASIHEINAVRKHLSLIKGGQLARLVRPAQLVTLIISDVTGDEVDVIASGPTVPDPSTFSDAFNIILKYNLESDITQGVLNYLKDGISGIHDETPKPDNPLFYGTINLITGTNMTALQEAKKSAIGLGFNTYIIDSEITGDVKSISELIFDTINAYRNNVEIKKPVCLLFGGETTVKVTGNGLGGRNQHLALVSAIKLAGIENVTLLAAGTDGTDGPTDAAGAVIDAQTLREASLYKIDPANYLYHFDSYNFFKKTGGHIITGPTFTNVMDLIIVLIE
jgi:glycerate 2-kinase